MRRKYKLTIEFSSDLVVNLHDNDLIQFENGLGYFVETAPKTLGSINHSFVYGTGKTKLKEIKKGKKK